MPAIKEITGKHVLIVMLSAFGVITAVNMVFVYLAVTGFPGLDTEDSYRKGLAYNTQISESRDIRKLGWRVDVSLTEDKVLEISFTDKAGGALKISDLKVLLTHPADTKKDILLNMSNPAPGQYSFRIDPETKGNRILRISALGPDARPLEQRQKLWLK